MVPLKFWPQQDLSRFRRMWKDGTPLRDILREFPDLTPRRARHLAERLEVRRPKGFGMPAACRQGLAARPTHTVPVKDWTEEDRQKFCQMWRDGVFANEIAAAFSKYNLRPRKARYVAKTLYVRRPKGFLSQCAARASVVIREDFEARQMPRRLMSESDIEALYRRARDSYANHDVRLKPGFLRRLPPPPAHLSAISCTAAMVEALGEGVVPRPERRLQPQAVAA